MRRLLARAALLLSLLLWVPYGGAAGRLSARAEPAPAVLQAQQQRVDVIARAKASVLAVFAPGGGGGGSGVVISPDGYALTNFHVAKPCGNAMKCGMADGRLYDAVIVGLDPVGDVALVKLFGRDDFPAAPLADSDRVQAGDWAFAMGNPFLLAADLQPTVTYGIISAVHRYQYPAGTLLEYTDCLQTDASINPGNSGGPLFDAQGRLIGINGRASFEKRGRVNVGAAYAVSINQIKHFLGALRGGRIVDHATLGARAGFDDDGRVIVVDISERSDAYRRGLRYGDELASFGGRPIETPNAFKNVLGVFPRGWRVPLSYRREGTRHDVLVRLAGLHSPEELIEKAMQEDRPIEIPGPKPKPDGPEPRLPPIRRLKLPPKDKIPDGEPQPDQSPLQMFAKKVPMPEVCKQHFESKHGYANYYFNKLERQRVWKAWSARGSFAGLGGPWVLSGLVEPGKHAFEFRLADQEAVLSVEKERWTWSGGDAPEASLEPPGKRGMLLALLLWRRLALEGPEHFGEVAYQGAAPLAGQEGLVDVLSAIHAGVECRFYFQRGDGRLLALEMDPAEDADPWEIRFGDESRRDGRWVPGSMEIRCGDEMFGAFSIQTCRFDKAAQSPAEHVPAPKSVTGSRFPDRGGMLSRREASGEHGICGGPSHADPRLRRVTACHPFWQKPLVALDALALALLLNQEAPPARQAAGAGDSLAEVIAQVQPKLVKIYGAGGLHGLEPYQSGMLISPEGHILTLFSTVLDTDEITVLLADGRKFEAKLLGADPYLEAAVLKIDGSRLPCFDLARAVSAGSGGRILAFSNAFGVATGNEAMSVQRGTISLRTNLEARRGTYETPYHGPVYVLDTVTNNSGAGGGALVTWRGELLGMLGKELRNSLNNTWLNYAVPIEELRKSVDEIRAGKFVARPEQAAPQKPAHAITLSALGIRLVPDILVRTPAYIDGVASGSPAAQAGLRQLDDLVVLVGEHLVQSCRALEGELELIDRDDRFNLTVLRGQDLKQFELKPAGGKAAP